MTEAEAITHSPHRRLFLCDRKTGQPFLIDTGASISIVPIPKGNRKRPADLTLMAANNTKIATYGELTKELDFGLRRPYRWTFVIADVTKAIIGADFLYWHHLTVDLRNRRLIDQDTGLSTSGRITFAEIPVISVIPENNKFACILREFPTITRTKPIRGPPEGVVEHHIETHGLPVSAKARRLPPGKYEEVRREINNMINEGICQPSKSQWSSPLHVVTKKDGTLRLCGDYRALNAQTTPDKYGVPNLRDFTMELHGKEIFSKIDLKKAYFHIPIAKKDREKTAIITPFGLIEFLRMNFGLKNAAQSFQRFVDSVFRDLNYVFKYVDDFLIASSDEEEHASHLREIFRRLDHYGIAINPDKCVFGVRELDFLGYHLTPEGITPLEARIKSILDFPAPKDTKQLRRFLGMLNFYRPCLSKAATIQQPLHNLLHNKKKNDQSPVTWTEETLKAFENSKRNLAEASRLVHPDASAEISLACDASDKGLGAVLQQKVGNKWYPLSFFSQSFNNAQKSYSVYDRELLAIYKAIKHFQPLLEGRHFFVVTDHRPLIHAFVQKPETATPMRIRYLNYISQFTTNIEYLPGRENIVADSLSRVEEIHLPDDFKALAIAQQQDQEVGNLMKQANLQMKMVEIPGTDCSLLCETSTAQARPYLPKEFRMTAFQRIHNLSHPSIRTTRKLMAQKFFWPELNKDVGDWARCCIPCQRAKIHRHTVTPLGVFQPSGRFEHVHLDLVGPLPPSDGYKYILTMIDRMTRWPEAVPLQEIDALAVANAFYAQWISRFGVPLRITTDQGRQFESRVFQELMAILGIQRMRTTAYHPQSNGCIERWHRSLKASLAAHMDIPNWNRLLPTVLMGLRASLRDDTSSSIAEALYGQPLRLPGEFLEEQKTVKDPLSALQELRNNLSLLRPVKTKHPNRKTFVHDELQTCSHVFLREDGVKKPLVPPYAGPYRVINRNPKFYTIQLPGREATVSLDRLKPAYLLEGETGTQQGMSVPPQTMTPTMPTQQGPDPPDRQKQNNTPAIVQPYQTRSGRTVKPKVYFGDSVIWRETM